MKKSIYHAVSYIVLLSPIILASVFVYGSEFPAWANTVLMAIIITFAITVLNIREMISKKEINILNLSANILAMLVVVVFVLTDSQKVAFSLFGKGVVEWTALSLSALSIIAGYFLTLKTNSKIPMAVSFVSIVYTLLNFVFIKYIPIVGQYTGYINIPLVSFDRLLNYAFIVSVVIFASSLAVYFLQKKGIVFTRIRASRPIFIFFIAVSILFFMGIASYVLRYVGAHNYLRASQELKLNNFDKAKEYINRAITVAPFDIYYLGRIELTSKEIQTLLNSSSSDKQALENKYRDLVERQISDAKKAIEYDNRSSSNYVALGLAYERSMLLTKDSGYKLAVEAYEKARSLSLEKDYIDVIKSKLSFSVGLEQDALSSLDRALEYNPSSAPALYLSSQYYSLKKNTSLAISYGEKTVKVAPNATDALVHLGLLYLQVNDFDKAIQSFGNAFNVSKQQDDVALYYLAVAYKTKKDLPNFKLVYSELEKRVNPESKEMKSLRFEVKEKIENKTKPNK